MFYCRTRSEITHREAIARADRKKLTGRVAQKGGVITVRDVRAKITKILTGRRIFQLYRIQFSNTGVTGGLYTRLSQLS